MNVIGLLNAEGRRADTFTPERRRGGEAPQKLGSFGEF